MDCHPLSEEPKENRNLLRSFKDDEQSIRKPRVRLMQLPDINYAKMKTVTNMYTPRRTVRNDYFLAERFHRTKKVLKSSSVLDVHEETSTHLSKPGPIAYRRVPEINFTQKNVEISSEKQRKSLKKSRHDKSQSTNDKVAHTHKASYIKLKNMTDKEMIFNDTLHKKAIESVACGRHCLGSTIGALTTDDRSGKCRSKEELIEHAKDFME